MFVQLNASFGIIFFREKVSPLFVVLLNRLIYNDKFHWGNIIIHYKDEVLIFLKGDFI